MMPLLIASLALAALGLMVWIGLARVDDGQVALLKRFGRTRKVLLPGTHVVVPFLDRVEDRVDTVGHSVELNGHAVAGGNGGWHVDGRVYYQILDPRRAAPALGHLDDCVTRELDRLLPQLLTEAADTPADQFNRALKKLLNERLRPQGLLVARTQIRAAA